MALTVRLPQDGHYTQVGTFEEHAVLFQDVSANTTILQTMDSTLTLVDRITIGNDGGMTLAAGGLTITAGGLTITAGGIAIVAGDLTIDDGVDLLFGTGNDAGFRWSTGDASNHALVLGLDNTSQQFHITDQGAIATDWARTAGTHPELAIHSNTTPATDYISIGNHDGTTATIDVVGGTTLNLDIAGTTEAVLTGASLDLQNNTLLNVGAAGNDLTASTYLLSYSNSGATNQIHVQNLSDTSDSGARLRATVAGSSSGDAFATFQETSSHVLAIGLDASASRFALSAATDLGTNDILRITDATPPVITYNTTHPTGTFDYVCEFCGEHAGVAFTCHGEEAKWHDDIGALLPALAWADRRVSDEALRHMVDIGVMDISNNNDDSPWIGINLQAAQWFTWAAMAQEREYIRGLETRMRELESLIGV